MQVGDGQREIVRALVRLEADPNKKKKEATLMYYFCAYFESCHCSYVIYSQINLHNHCGFFSTFFYFCGCYC